MKKLIVLAAMVVGLSGCAGMGKNWTKADTARQAVFTGLALADWSQTKHILEINHKEHNPLISEDTVDIYFPAAILAHAAVSYALSPEYRKWWQYITIGTQAFCVGRNIAMGFEFGF
jgi:hypothetical protein